VLCELEGVKKELFLDAQFCPQKGGSKGEKKPILGLFS